MKSDPNAIGRTGSKFSASAATILATEHWSVLGTRSMYWAEAAARTTIFLTVLSAAVVALALVADATAFGSSFFRFAMFLLPVVLFLGLVTFARLLQINVQDRRFVLAMNRLRHGYLDLAPELEPYFATSHYDDLPGMVASYSFGGTAHFRPWMQFMITTPTVIATINSALFTAGATLVTYRMTGSTPALVAVGATAFITSWVLQFMAQWRHIARFRRDYVPHFPSDETEEL